MNAYRAKTWHSKIGSALSVLNATENNRRAITGQSQSPRLVQWNSRGFLESELLSHRWTACYHAVVLTILRSPQFPTIKQTTPIGEPTRVALCLLPCLCVSDSSRVLKLLGSNRTDPKGRSAAVGRAPFLSLSLLAGDRCFSNFSAARLSESGPKPREVKRTGNEFNSIIRSTWTSFVSDAFENLRRGPCRWWIIFKLCDGERGIYIV